MTSRILTFLSTLAIAMLAFTATATAANVVTPDDGSLLDLAGPVLDAVAHGQWWIAASAAVVLICVAARRYLPEAWGGARIRSRVGLAALAFGVSFAGAVSNALIAGAAMSWPVALAALKIAIGSAVALLAGSTAASAIAAKKATA